MVNIECTLEDLYKFNKKFKFIEKGFFKVETQYGFKKIEKIDITAKNSAIYYIETETEKKLEASPDHLLYSKIGWKKIKNFEINELIKTIDGWEKLKKIIKLNNTDDLYDIQVNEVGEFYANKIISHNSSIINIPKILLYGKSNKINKDDIANRINKHAWIRGDIQVNPNTFVTIERKLSPSDLYVEKNGEDIGKSGIVDYQNFIDTEVTGLPYHIFSNIISLSINDFKSFINMSPNDKRAIIDKLFAMEIINKMNEFVKKDLRDIKNNIELYNREIQTLDKYIKNASKELEDLQNKVQEDNTIKLNSLLKQIEDLKPKLTDAYSKLQDYQKNKTKIESAYAEFTKQKIKITHEISEHRKKFNLFNQDKCPTCETPFNDNRFIILKGELEEHIKSKETELNNLSTGENKYLILLKQINEGISQINLYIGNAQRFLSTISGEYEKLKQDKPKEFDSIKNIISQGNIKLKQIEENKVNLDDDNKFLSILEQLYSDNGIKKRILESYLPTLNREIEYSLIELHFPYSLVFNSDFEPEMSYLGMSINADTLSTGEKKSVDLAVLISIIKMLKRKYPNLNIFLLDEVLSSLDGDKIYDVLGVLKNTAKELCINIFIVNHTNLPIEYFSYRIDVSKKDGFSDLYIEKLENGEETFEN
jgi:DNA repair exonuclease SbcCD ATPase subunit